MWEIDFAAQIFSFLKSILLGGIYGLIYDLFRFPVRRREASAITVFAVDILYFAFIAVINFCFLLTVTNGEVRGYLLLGAALGFAAYKKTLSPVLKLAAALVLKPIRVLFSLLNRGIKAVFSPVITFFSKIIKKISEIIKKRLKKSQ